MAPPRRANATIDGIVWLPRLIDKARAYDTGTLGPYLFGQSPVDASFLRAAGIDHPTFLSITRASADDFGVIAELERRAPGAHSRLRAWTAKRPLLCRIIARFVDADEGYATTAAGRLVGRIPPVVFEHLMTLVRRVKPFREHPL